MASTIAAVTTSGGGVVTTADASGNLNLLAGTTTVVALTTAGAAVTGTLSSTTGANFATSSGNVGIGTASPSQKLEVYAAANSLQIESVVRNDQAGTGVAAIGFNVSSGAAAETSSTKAGIGLVRTNAYGVGSLCFYNNSTTSAGNFTTADERMRIDSSGNVGIGTSSPSSYGKLTVDDTAASSVYVRSSSTNFAGLLLDNTNSATKWQLGVEGGTYNTAGKFNLGISGVGTAIAIDTSRNVGIGTTSPGGKLEVVGGRTFLSAASEPFACGVRYVSTGGSFYFGAASSSATPDGVFSQAGGAERMRITDGGFVGIGTGATVNYRLELSTDSAGKPGAGGLWTVVSDERIKSNIVPANLDRCYEIVKSVPLKHFGFAPGVYTDDQIQDKHNLGWIAQDVQKVFKNAVSVKPFTLKTDIPDGAEEYEEQDFTLEAVEKTETSIQVINGKAVQVSKVVTSENKVMLFDTVDVLDEAGAVVMDGDKPLTYQMPRMVKKTKPKVRHDVIEDCLDLNSGQMIAALYGAVQALMAIVDTQATRIAALEAK
jgi:hypothetical protein